MQVPDFESDLDRKLVKSSNSVRGSDSADPVASDKEDIAAAFMGN
jgi:hypothetical protein